ncbi:hypothetical protein NE236_41875 [Actinoallomurus purpureus]|uniref:hypothetical protein n=1 Tax=Actinoallomurus purpureus TaxID=478114 RepID=UPI0020928144|nr:hypothetical protein [Actinoallomurus purpureus]MCO6011520.1 hypothetical protein [Actinoallomurus purpureus]
MTKKPAKNRSARDKRLARERARREARAPKCPLFELRPPFEAYSEWITVPAHIKDFGDHRASRDPRLDAEMRKFVTTVIKLGPLYQGRVPTAALYLDDQMSRGTVAFGVPDSPGLCAPYSLDALVDQLSDPEFYRAFREENPEIQLPEQLRPIEAGMVPQFVHELHMHGVVIMDDDQVLNLALPPQAPGDGWLLSGYEDPVPAQPSSFKPTIMTL